MLRSLQTLAATQEDTMPSPPSNAISVRIKGKSASKAGGQRRHDLRVGRQPKHIDGDRTNLNRVLVEPPTPAVLRKRTITRRERMDPARSMQATASVVMTGIITFGKGAQEAILAAPVDRQDAAYRAVAQAIGERYQVDVLGLVVHADETAPHAHVMWDSRTEDGESAQKIILGSELQDIAAAAIAPFFPTIERGVPKKARIQAGEPLSKTVHRSVKQLHEDLPQEIEAVAEAIFEIRLEQSQAKSTLAELEEKIRKLEDQRAELDEKIAASRATEDKAQKRIEKLESREGELTERQAKTLATYERRVAKARTAAEEAEKKRDNLQDQVAGLEQQLETKEKLEKQLPRLEANTKALTSGIQKQYQERDALKQEIVELEEKKMPTTDLLTRGLRRKERELHAEFDKRKQGLDDREKKLKADIQAREEESRKSRETLRAALAASMTGIAEGHVEPAVREGRWTIHNNNWWEKKGKTALHPGPLGWGQKLWQTLRKFAATQVSSLKKQVDNLQAQLTRKEDELTTITTELKTARGNESTARREKGEAVKNAKAWQDHAGQVKQERDELRRKYEPPARYSSPSMDM